MHVRGQRVRGFDAVILFTWYSIYLLPCARYLASWSSFAIQDAGYLVLIVSKYDPYQYSVVCPPTRYRAYVLVIQVRVAIESKYNMYHELLRFDRHVALLHVKTQGLVAIE